MIREDDASYDTMSNCMKIVRNAETEKGSYFQLQVYAKMYELFYELFANDYVKIIDAESKSKKYRALMRVTNYIDEHYSEGVSLEEVADATGISRYYVSHLFKELMDSTFVGYVNELRLNRAAMLLMTTDMPVIEISSLCPASTTSQTSTGRSKCILTKPLHHTEKDNPKVASHNI